MFWYFYQKNCIANHCYRDPDLLKRIISDQWTYLGWRESLGEPRNNTDWFMFGWVMFWWWCLHSQQIYSLRVLFWGLRAERKNIEISDSEEEQKECSTASTIITIRNYNCDSFAWHNHNEETSCSKPWIRVMFMLTGECGWTITTQNMAHRHYLV